MGLENAKPGKLLYHLTKLSNLPSIVEKGLLPRKTLLGGVGFADVANPEIISERAQLGLDTYIPFHFHPYSAFDKAVKSAFPDDDFMYICIMRDFARHNNFKILAKHPLSVDKLVLHDYDTGIELIDWDTLMEVGRIDNDARQIKMAECLTDEIIPAKHFFAIAVKDAVTKEKVEDILRAASFSHPPPYIDIQSVWF